MGGVGNPGSQKCYATKSIHGERSVGAFPTQEGGDMGLGRKKGKPGRGCSESLGTSQSESKEEGLESLS